MAFWGAMVASTSACSLLDITPQDVVPSVTAFNDVPSYQMALNRMYRDLTSPQQNMATSDFASDDFRQVIEGYAPSNYNIFHWNYTAQPQPFVWQVQYQQIARANVIMDNYDVVTPQSDEEKNEKDQIMAQALAMRAWSYFNLVELYAPRYTGQNGDQLAVPLKLKLDREYLGKSTLKEVYDQMFNDLDRASEIFKETNFNPSSSDAPYVFGQQAVWALKARIALYMGDMKVASENAAHFINTPLLDKDNYWKLWEDQVGSDNQEVIFETDNLSDTDDASLIDYQEIYEFSKVKLALELLQSFEADDIRKDKDYISTDDMPNKYIVQVNDRNTAINRNLCYKYFRLAEQYLIYAEANMNTDKTAALRVFNTLRKARGASEVSTLTATTILQERRRELFSEGLRFYDLKRKAQDLNIVVKRSTGEMLPANSPKYNWSVPLEEINANPNISE